MESELVVLAVTFCGHDELSLPVDGGRGFTHPIQYGDKKEFL